MLSGMAMRSGSPWKLGMGFAVGDVGVDEVAQAREGAG